MYVFRFGPHSPIGSSYRSVTLTEMTPRQLLAAQEEAERDGRGVEYRRATVREAHRHVLDDRVHETPLWVDCGKIRRARG